MLHTTNYLVSLLWIAGVVQASDVLANVAIPAKIGSRENLARVSPIIRQIFWSHWFFIALVLLFFSALCFLFAPFLAGGTPPGRFVSGALAVFWFLRTLTQLLWFDREFRRRHRFADLAFIISSALLAVIFAVASLRVMP
jgi:hypothetical protein